MMNTLVICIEGIDGAGKTTFAKQLAQSMQDSLPEWQVSQLKFPSVQPPKGASTDWFFEDFKKVLKEKRQEIDDEGGNHLVIIDRCFLSTAVYSNKSFESSSTFMPLLIDGHELFMNALKAKRIFYHRRKTPIRIASERILGRPEQDNPDDVDGIKDRADLERKLATLQKRYDYAFASMIEVAGYRSCVESPGLCLSLEQAHKFFYEEAKSIEHSSRLDHEKGLSSALKISYKKAIKDNKKLREQVDRLVKIIEDMTIGVPSGSPHRK